MQIPLVGGAYTSRSLSVNAQTCVNLFPVIDKQDAKSELILFGTPGLRSFSAPEIGLASCVRASRVVKDFLYVLIAANIYKIDSSGWSTLLGSISTTSGPAIMEDNGLQIIITDGTVNGYIITLATGVLTAITDPAFVACLSVTFQDGYFIVLELGTEQFFISDLYNGLVWNSLDFASAEARPDNALVVIANVSDLWILGIKSVEVFYDSGNADFPFERIPGAVIDTGCGAIKSPVKINGQVYFITDKRQVVRNTGYQLQIVSTPHIDYRLSKMLVTSDAIGMEYMVDNHDFYVLTFPSENETWVLDTITGYWHRWSSVALGGAFKRHRANCLVLFNNKWVAGDYENGTLYQLDMEVYSDNGSVIRRERTAQTISKDQSLLLFSRLEVEFEEGVGLDGSVQGSDPQVILDWSNDNGKTWSNQHWKSIGKIGQYKNKTVWRQLGRAYNRTFRLVISDPVKVVIVSAFAEIEECK